MDSRKVTHKMLITLQSLQCHKFPETFVGIEHLRCYDNITFITVNNTVSSVFFNE